MKGVREEYAEAVFQLALEGDQIKAFQDEMSAFVAACNQETMKFFAHPKITKEEKKEALAKTVMLPLARDFLCVLVDNGRIDMVKDIKLAYDELVDDYEKVKKVTVYTAKPLSAAQKHALAEKLGKKYNRKIAITESIDTNIISGIRIRVDDNVIDATSNRQLEDMKSMLKKDER